MTRAFSADLTRAFKVINPVFFFCVLVQVVAAAQPVKEVTEITQHHSLQLTRSLLRIAIFQISYIRGLFPEDYFLDTSVPSLDMKVKKLLPRDLESRRLIDWMEKGVYDALTKKYLKTMLFTLCEAEDGPAVEEYSFSFDYSKTSEEVSMHVAKIGSHKRTLKTGGVAAFNSEQMRKAACKMMRTLITLMRTLDEVPAERTLLVKLYYYDDITPVDYEPPFFRCCTFDEKKNWLKPSFKIKAGEVNTEIITLSLKVKSTLDPCGDEYDINQDSTCALASSRASDISSDSDSDKNGEANAIQDEDHCTSKILLKESTENDFLDDDEMTQDINQETFNLETVKEWLLSLRRINFHITDLMANFPEISAQHTEELLSRMVKEGFLIDLGKDQYEINHKTQVEDYCQIEKSKTDETVLRGKEKEVDDDVDQEDSMYLKALYYALPLDYITIKQLQTNLGDDISHLTTRKLIEKMVNEGYVEGTAANRKIGRRVIHSEQAHRKLQKVKEVLNPDQLLVQEHDEGWKHESPSYVQQCQKNLQKSQTQVGNHQTFKQAPGTEDMEGSTCGALQSFGSEITRYEVGSSHNHTAEDITSCAQPKISKRANSRESHLNIASPLKQKIWSKRGFELRDSQDTINTDLPRKASMVEEPIYQMEKRIRRDLSSKLCP